MSKLLKKSQIWYIDLILAITIFTIMLIFSFKYLAETYIFEENQNILSEGDKLSEKLMTPGIPENWTNNYVISVGITTKNKLNLSKLYYFDNITIDDYPSVKALFGLRSDFIVFFENRTGQVLNFTNTKYIGMPEKNQTNIEAEERIDVERYLTYNHNNISEIVLMKVVLWN